ncbi:protein kinase [Luteolibacter sp. Populi]|uniref:protein kinase domain-containing protein n=1 Tax=Luteolibacter sp. Populi TaxID=3230487 RepID=UPI003465DAB2
MSADPFEAPSIEHLAELLPAYEFEAFIAKGGMGAVYKARQRSLDRDVAIKILPREFGEDPEFVASFETEAKAMARLNHPNLIGVYDYGEVDGMPYIVMEFVNGKSLFHSAVNLAVDPVQAVGIVKGICDGLAHAHENGVIHRDIKPANILLTPRAVPKIGDFGLARPADMDGSGLVMGTPGYVAREVLQHPEKADRRSDLFALGVVLYELLIGRCPPYDSTPPPSTLCGCDISLDRICAKAMNPLADLRYQTAEEMSADLDAWLRHSASAPGSAGPAALPQQSPVGPRRLVPQTAGYRVEHQPSSSSGAVKGLLMLAAAIVVVAIGWSKYNSSQQATADAIQQAQATQPKAKDEPAKAVPSRPVKPDESPEPAEALAPLESLAKLKSALVSGAREPMPEGSVALGTTHFMVIPTPLGWAAASAFAAEHGAHLFVAKSAADLEKLAALTPPAEGGAEAGLWIGAGSAGKDQWSWIDGTPWQAALQPEGEGSYLVLDAKGALQVREPADRYPFAIQWREDGKNPAALAEMLGRSGDSIAAGAPVYPPGTLAQGGSLVFIATGPATYEKALELAMAAGGKLISPSTRELDDWIATKLPASGGSAGYWLGGMRESDAWQWASGAAWDYTRWSDEAQASGPGGRLKALPGRGWVNDFPDSSAAGFIIEWAGAGKAGLDGSDPSVPPPVVEEKLPPALADLEAKARQLVDNLSKERDKALAANAKTFQWDLDTWMKDLSKNELAAWKRDVEMLKKSVVNNRVPAKLDAAAGGFRMSEQMSKVAGFCADKQTAIDADFNTKAGKIRDSYVTRMNAAVAASPPDVAATIQRRVTAASDLDAWLGSFGVEEAKPVVLQAGFKILSATYGAGGKDADVTERVQKLLITERRAFWVNPGDLGADPSPGWNKGLTVKYEANGTPGQKSWGENAKVSPEDFLAAE